MCKKTAKFLQNGLWVRDKSRIELLPYESITHIYHRNGFSRVHMGTELLKILRTPLACLEGIMPENQFFRTHRNYIINRSFIKQYDPEEPLIYFVCGQKIPVSRRKKRPFETFLEDRGSHDRTDWIHEAS